MSGLIDGVEGVEKFLLGALLAGDKLNIVHQQKIHLPIAGAKIIGGALFDGLDQLNGEFIALDVSDFRGGVPVLDRVADGHEQVGLAQAGVAVDEEGIVIFPRLLRHGDGGGVGELVGVADDKAIKGIAGHLGQRGILLGFGDVIVQLIPGQNDNVKITGKEIRQRRLDGIAEALKNDVPFEVGRGMQNQTAVLHIHRLTVGEPGGDGGGGQLLRENANDLIPDFLKRIHARHLEANYRNIPNLPSIPNFQQLCNN